MFKGFAGIVKYIQLYYQAYFKPGYFFAIILMLAGIIYVNYQHIPLPGTMHATWLQKFGAHYLLYFLPFAAAYAGQYFFYKNLFYFKLKWFWVLIILAPAFFSFRVNFNFHHPLIQQQWQAQEMVFWIAAFNLVVKALVLIIPAGLLWWYKNLQKKDSFGFKKTTYIQPYFILLLMMFPLVVLASYNPAFLKQYPRGMNVVTDTLADKSGYWLLYELCYAFDFLSIEFFFRGFLIIAFTRICGMHAVIPAACFYCCIHLGKPMPEAISSFFGGLLLGIISYNTKSIWGGLIIHIGIAWLMELLAFLQHP